MLRSRAGKFTQPAYTWLRSNPENRSIILGCFAEPVIGPAEGRTRWLAMTAGAYNTRCISSKSQ